MATIKKVKVKIKELFGHTHPETKQLVPNRIAVTDKGTVRIPHNVDMPEVGDEVEVGEDWITAGIQPPKPLTPEDVSKAAAK